MGFLKRSKVPNELPDLAVSSSQKVPSFQEVPKPPFNIEQPRPVYQNTIEQPKIVYQKLPTEIVHPKPSVHMEHKQIAGEDYLEFSTLNEDKHDEIKKQIHDSVKIGDDHKSFFDTVLDDINGEIKDLGKLENWYQNKFLPQDVVSNMRLYWEDNKADMIIKSFGNEYKQKINEKIKHLQELEADWREIYFRLIKKEEDMKKEERNLKETLSEFVELCKRRKGSGEKKD